MPYPSKPPLRRAAATLALCCLAAAAAAVAQPSHHAHSKPSSQPTTPAQPNWTLGPFTRPIDAPILTPNPKAVFFGPIRHRLIHWEVTSTFNPAAIVRHGKVYVLYRAEDNTGKDAIGMHTSRLGLAWSTDGIHFTRRPTPVFYPANDAQKTREWPGGVEDPRITQGPHGTYYLTYTQWNRKATSVGLATSKDLLHWKKYGPIFPHTLGPAFRSYKSAGILTHLVHGRLIAAKLHGKYWMYWGEKQVHLAWSRDLIHWTPVMNPNGHALVLLKRRPGLFDSGFPEMGPPPVLTSKGIVVIYNAKNAAKHGDPALGPGAYSDGQALFSASDPAKLLARTKKPFFKPTRPYEKTGQYGSGTTFAEGLVYFHHRWFLYYGCADSRVGVAVSPPSPSQKGK